MIEMVRIDTLKTRWYVFLLEEEWFLGKQKDETPTSVTVKPNDISQCKGKL